MLSRSCDATPCRHEKIALRCSLLPLPSASSAAPLATLPDQWTCFHACRAHTRLSNLARIRKITPISVGAISRINVPRLEVVTTRPSRSKRNSASRTGPRLTLSSSARSPSMILCLGRNLPANIAFRRCASTRWVAGRSRLRLSGFDFTVGIKSLIIHAITSSDNR